MKTEALLCNQYKTVLPDFSQIKRLWYDMEVHTNYFLKVNYCTNPDFWTSWQNFETIAWYQERYDLFFSVHILVAGLKECHNCKEGEIFAQKFPSLRYVQWNVIPMHG